MPDPATNPSPSPAQRPKTQLEPPDIAETLDNTAAPPERGGQLRAESPELQGEIARLVDAMAADTTSPTHKRLVADLVTTALKLLPDGRDTGELKLMTAALKELRYAYRVFGQYAEPFKVTIFGSARTPADHPDYIAAVEFSRLMAQAGWMVITGAGDGIMKAGHEGPGRDASFGVAIRLPFEQKTNSIIDGDSKLINFRYFFTRKLMFLSQAEAVVCFPGGFGTLDETFETLTLIQTGKATMVPLVFVEGHDAPGSSEGRAPYWHAFDGFMRDQLLARGWIGEEDTGLYHLAKTPQEAADVVLKFYRVYHSARYVRDDLIIRLRRPIPAEWVERLNDEFAVLLRKGRIEACDAHSMEQDHRALPRLSFTHTRRNFGLLRRLIDRINEAPPAPGTA